MIHMHKQGNRYIHEGRHTAFIAEPNLGVAALALVCIVAGWVVTVIVGRRWVPWLRPLERSLRNMMLTAGLASIVAGGGISVLRVGTWVYIEGTWISASNYLGVYEHNTVNPMRPAHRIVRWGSGKSVETTLDLKTIEWAFSKAAGK